MNIEYRIEEIKQDIRYYENCIKDLNEEIRKYRRENEELDDAHKKYIKIRNQFDEFQYNHEIKSKTLESEFKNIKFSKQLSSNIASSLRGNSAKRSSSSIEVAKNNIQQKIYSNNQDIQDAQNRIQYYHNEINDLEHELTSLLYRI